MAVVEKTSDTGAPSPEAASQTATVERLSPTQFTRLPWRNRLSNKLLLLTALAVLITEVLIFVPSVASMRVRWMSSRLDTVGAVSEVLAASGNMDVPREIQDKVLLATGTKAIAMREAGASRLLAMSEVPGKIDQVIDLNNISEAAAIWDAFGTLFNGGDRTLRIFGSVSSGSPDRIIEIVTSDAPLRHAMLVYARNVTFISLIISVIAASLIYLIIHEMLLRPVRIMHRNMIDFASSPDNPALILVPENRKDEFGIAQRQISHIQSDLQRTLKEQKHLADLGLAVSKINHDMRNILASAQLMSDRLADTEDPMVQRFAPKLIRTLSRAISYSESVMAYGRSQEAPPRPRRVLLHAIIADVQETLSLRSESNIEFENLVPEDFELNVDSEQLFRVLSNLCRNSVQAMERDQTSDVATVKRLTISAGRIGTTTIIGVEDTGPGLPQKARDNLFTAFRGSTRSDGTGLGLAIAQELVRAHGGTIELREDRPVGAHFEIRIPDLQMRYEDRSNQRTEENA
ncbi:signal transduction histidine kinase [Ochrobactrum sp. J50]|jgi:signal transduction histidine kinase|uniref:histidine kinase n=1 Tax=Brucella pseudintermedia TaxID=370111 RepID=A0ABY5U9F8_9HYPH|nr:MULTISPECIES: HAMP domain-containing sensor histidine kinase [Brucella/Ochrobactrum group]MCO7725313.1 HAMP domain-containing histidine kinase [Brucella intermedia]NKE75905.1 HAMP domain-containing histidine kinase [Ochrobactrum sp. MC-1LL]TWH02031.1 signal transduction histidine kinase [Ochrobactrum sp. J50]UWL59966.1 HAMP domain-containing histidine kinase [Brucella pseudintermedia]WPM80387.1 HAMP domain-containing sensor histidine kinase [Brucella pseudintermedia]